MAEKYDIDMKRYAIEDSMLTKYNADAIVKIAGDWIDRGCTDYVVKDMVETHRRNGTISDNQKSYLIQLCRFQLPEYFEYEKAFFAWYDSRPDIQEIYHYGMSSQITYIQDDNGSWIQKGQDSWNTDWEQKPANSRMFWRVAGDWNVRKFKEIKRETTFEEGDLVVLRKAQVGNWRYDPYYDGSNTPDKTNDRIGTVMQMTEQIHNRSRAGKGSRVINVLWIGSSDIKGVPERIIKHHERKRKGKKPPTTTP